MCLEARSQRGRDSRGEKRALFSVTAAFPVRRRGLFGCREMFFFPPADRKRSPPTPTELVVETETRYVLLLFFLFFFNLKTSESASDVGPRAESIAGSVHRRDGAHVEFLRWWHFQKRCRAAAVRHVASPPPHRRV